MTSGFRMAVLAVLGVTAVTSSVAASDPLVTSALVTRPAMIDGVESWTIETVLPRGGLQALAAHPAEPRFVTGGSDSVVRIWNSSTFELERVLVGHSGYVSVAAWSRDAKYLATGAYDDEVVIWDAGTGRIIRRIRAQTGGVYTLAWSADGTWIATGGDGNDNLRIWDIRTGNLIRHLQGHEKSVLASAVSPDGGWLASAADDTTIRIWNIATWEAVKVLRGHPSRIRGISWSPDGAQIVSGGNDGILRIWDVAQSRLLHELRDDAAAANSAIYSVGWSGDGQLVAAAYSENRIRTWQPEDGRLLKSFSDHTTAVMTVSWLGASHELLAIDNDGGIRRWDADAGTSSARIEGSGIRVPAVAWSSSGEYLTGGTADGRLIVWQPTTGGFREIAAHRLAVRSLASHPRADLLASASDDQTVCLWDVATGARQRTLEGHSAEVQVVAFAPDGTRLASGGSDGTIRLWSMPTPDEAPRVLAGHQGAVYALAWSADGETLAAGDSGGNVVVWNVAAAGIRQQFHSSSYSVRSLAWVPGEKTIAVGSHDLRLWNVAAGTEEHELAGHTNWVYSLRRGNDPFVVASCSRDRTIRVWDLKTATQLRMNRGHAGQIDTLDWSRDGGSLATGSTWDGTIRLWNAESLSAGPVLLPLPGGPVAISPEGHVQTTGDAGRQIAIIVQTAEGQQTYRPSEFASRFQWMNRPEKVRLPEK